MLQRSFFTVPLENKSGKVGGEGERHLTFRLVSRRATLPPRMTRPHGIFHHAAGARSFPHSSSSIRNPEDSFETKLEGCDPDFSLFSFFNISFNRDISFPISLRPCDIISLSFGALMTSLNYLSIAQWDQSLHLPLPRSRDIV